MKVEEISLSMAQRGICITASLSIPTRRQYTNERHSIERSYSTKSTLKALWFFRRDAKAFAKELATMPGDYELSPSNHRSGLFWT